MPVTEEEILKAAHVPSARHVVALHQGRPSAARVAREFLAAGWIPGEVRDDNWDPGKHAPPTSEPESEGSQVPPARDNDGHELED